jgi:hypothetical protein
MSTTSPVSPRRKHARTTEEYAAAMYVVGKSHTVVLEPNAA